MSTQEGFDDARAAHPDATVVVTDRACSSDPAFTGALREFCLRVAGDRAGAL
ncbi:MAG TPA: hypothetical protein VKA89_11090 [Solirubrobacterales bacterium]|nr:hypothetical protein [Solirubrobacterales bacterium]